MSFGDRASGLRERRRARGQGAAVELTPLIDIVFQLLIFFLLTATFQNNPSFKVNLPKADNQDIRQEPKAVVVTIGLDGKMEIDNKPVDDRELQMRLCKAADTDDATGVNIRADESAAHKHVVRVMDVARECGLERLGILHGR